MKIAFKTKATATALSAAIAMTSVTATPAAAVTDEEMLLFMAGLAAIAILHNASAPVPPAPVPAPAPITYSTGPLTLKQTFSANFDNGNIGGPGTDIWFQAVNPTHRYLKPRNGARIAVGDRSNRGFAGCSVASFTHHRVNINQIPVGSYVCMKTNAGRISQFRVNAVYGGAVKKMKLGYTTWQ